MKQKSSWRDGPKLDWEEGKRKDNVFAKARVVVKMAASTAMGGSVKERAMTQM